MTTFNQFGLKEDILKAVAALGFTTPSPIQEKTIPLLIQNPQTDITALAQTGTGKTAAFGLPLLQQVLVDDSNVQALILSPTRELCMQIQEELGKYGKFIRGFKSVAVYGGTPIGGQIRELKRAAQVVVATPGRLIDLLERQAIHLDNVTTVVLDEADEMLNMGFRDDIDFILKNTPARNATWLFSATMNNDVRRIARRFMKDTVEVAVAKENVTNENIDHQYFVTNAHQRYDALKRLLDMSPDIYGIIFTRTKQDAQDVSEKLMREGYHVSPLHGDMDQKMRTKVMDRFKKKQLQAIVATDVAARGIDVNDITHVINYELPEDAEVYTHRSGRTARAGKSGICMSIITQREIGKIRQIERIAKSRFHRSDIPDGNEIIRRRLFHFIDKIKSAAPQEGFAAIYKANISEKLDELDKDELIDRLLWLQIKDTLEDYEHAPDLNAGYEEHFSALDKKFTRLYINLGTKDGINPEKLIQFITDMTDVEAKLINRITVRELSSFFNVPHSAAEFIEASLSKAKYNNRRVRVEEADQKPRGFGDKGPRDYQSRPGKSNNINKNNNTDKPKYQRARKPLK